MSNNINPHLIPYRVMLHEEPGDKFQMVFECMAEDDDHAVEQAENAYPGCNIISYLPFDNSPLLYVIYSPNESAMNAGAGFWSHQDGWTELDEASKFSHSEKQTLNLPVSTGQDAKWVLFDEAREYFGTVKKEALDAFRHEVALCMDCMLQDDAQGETMVFVREDARLTPKVIRADAIDLDNLQQYEMILFDGGNSAGDRWKHTFFPKQLQHHFVDENPLPVAMTVGNMMMVSLDGGQTFQPAPEGVRIAYQKVMVDGEDGRGELIINATHEGLITDLWVHRDDPEVSLADYNHNIGTDCVMLDDMVSRLVQAGE